jgi:hypothetical protein
MNGLKNGAFLKDIQIQNNEHFMKYFELVIDSVFFGIDNFLIKKHFIFIFFMRVGCSQIILENIFFRFA